MGSLDDDDPMRPRPARWERTRLPDRAELLRRRAEPAAPADPFRRVAIGWGGDFEPPGAAKQTDDARRLFLDAIKTVEPRVLADLAGEPFAAFWPDYKRLVGEGGSPLLFYRARVAAWVSADDGPPPGLSGEPVARPAYLGSGWQHRKGRLLEWAARWRLDRTEGDWLLWLATQTVLDWCLRQMYRENGRDDVGEPFAEWSPPGRFYEIPTGARWEIAFPAFAWTPYREAWNEAEARIVADVKRRLLQWHDAIEAELLKAGYTTAKAKADGIAHFEWLALYQIGELSAAEIAERVNRAPQTVRDGFRDAASLAGVTLRERDRGGYPRGRRRGSARSTIARPRGRRPIPIPSGTRTPCGD